MGDAKRQAEGALGAEVGPETKPTTGGEAETGPGPKAGSGDEAEAVWGAPTNARFEPQLEALLGMRASGEAPATEVRASDEAPATEVEANVGAKASSGARGEAGTSTGARASPTVRTEKLPWRLEYLGAGGATRHVEAGRATSVGEAVYFAVRGALPERLPLIYVVQLENVAPPHLVRVALLAVARELGQPGEEVRLPREGTFLFNQAAGQLVVLAAERALSLEQLTELLKGREPPPDPVKTGST